MTTQMGTRSLKAWACSPYGVSYVLLRIESVDLFHCPIQHVAGVKMVLPRVIANLQAGESYIDVIRWLYQRKLPCSALAPYAKKSRLRGMEISLLRMLVDTSCPVERYERYGFSCPSLWRFCKLLLAVWI